jgi:2-isopropylmalate synthase
MKRIEIFDSTLRDGAQGENISYSVRDKLNIVRALDEFGVDYIEAGNPGSNPKDIEFFKEAQKIKLNNSKLVAFGSTCKKGLKPQDDPQIAGLLGANTGVVAVFGKCWDLHIKEILGVDEVENLRMVGETVSFFKGRGKETVFDAEHFFDGFKANPACALEVLKAAAGAGADVIVLCDTNGGCLPQEVSSITSKVVEALPNTRIGIHCHNDTGCAVASTIAAVLAGAVHAQGTFIGTGERCGNTDLSVLLPNLVMKLGYSIKSNDLTGLSEASSKIYEVSNLIPQNDKPYTGVSAFAHKAGMHIDGVEKCDRSFEHVPPASVGNKRRFLLSEMSGRSTILAQIAGIAPELTKNSPEIAAILERVKAEEAEGYQFESADASFELIVLEILGRFKPHFKLHMYKTSGERPAVGGEQNAYAVVKIAVGEHTETSASMGNGPVNALDLALRKALATFYPEVGNIHLIDYKVRVLSGFDATGAKVRVLIETTDGKNTWTTVGVSTDIIEASWKALVDAIEIYLTRGQTLTFASKSQAPT